MFIRFTIVFLDAFLDLFNSITVDTFGSLPSHLFIALRLDSNTTEFVCLVRFFNGSTVVEFDVLLPSNTTIDEPTIRNNLEADIFRNETTQELFRYFPTQPASVSDTILQVNGNFVNLEFLFFYSSLSYCEKAEI